MALRLIVYICKSQIHTSSSKGLNASVSGKIFKNTKYNIIINNGKYNLLHYTPWTDPQFIISFIMPSSVATLYIRPTRLSGEVLAERGHDTIKLLLLL